MEGLQKFMPTDAADLGRFTDVALLILLSFVDGAKHGYAMIEDIRTFSGTMLEPGTLYGALLRLEQRGWIAPQPAAARRRPYAITAPGLAALQASIATLQRLVTVGITRGALA
jgi:DNA-binding PadR family transcriptional regulator